MVSEPCAIVRVQPHLVNSVQVFLVSRFLRLIERSATPIDKVNLPFAIPSHHISGGYVVVSDALLMRNLQSIEQIATEKAISKVYDVKHRLHAHQSIRVMSARSKCESSNDGPPYSMMRMNKLGESIEEDSSS